MGDEKLEKNNPRLLAHRDLIKFGSKLIYRFMNDQTKKTSAGKNTFSLSLRSPNLPPNCRILNLIAYLYFLLFVKQPGNFFWNRGG